MPSDRQEELEEIARRWGARVFVPEGTVLRGDRCQAESIDRLEQVALEALRSTARPPNDEWKVALD